jgi:hypothetical protein
MRLTTSALVILGIAASACSDGGPSAPPAVASIQLSAAANDMVPGSTQTLSATALDASGRSISGATFSWSSSNTMVATVSATGLVQAKGAGNATITATSGGRTGSVEYVVAPGGLVGAAGGQISTPGSTVALAIPAGAVPAETKVTIVAKAEPTGNEHAIGGTTHEFGPSGIQFAQPVAMEHKYDPAKLPAGVSRASLRVAKLVNGAWQILTEGASVDTAAGKVRASVRSFSTYGVVADPCEVSAWTLPSSINGKITLNDCLFKVAGRRSDYHLTNLGGNSMMLEFEATGTLDGLFGLVTSERDAAGRTIASSNGLVLAVADIGRKFRYLDAGSRDVQVFVSGRDSTKFGDYKLTATPITGDFHQCGTNTVISGGVGGIFVGGDLQERNSCKVAVQFSPVPQAIGKQLWAHYYITKFEAGKLQEIGLEFGSLQNAALSVFFGGKLVTQSVPDGTNVPSRRLSFTPATTGYYAIEVSSGMFSDPGRFTTWVNPTGTFTLSLTGVPN